MPFPMKDLLDDLLLKSISDMGEGVLVFDFPKLIFTNEAFQKLSGYSNQQLLDLPDFLNLIADVDRRRIGELLDRFRAGNTPLDHLDFHLQKRAGKAVHVEAVFSRWAEEGEGRLIALVREFKRRNGSAKLEDFTQYLFEKNPNPMLVYDLETFAVLAVNEAVCRKYGYEAQKFRTLTVQDFHPVEDRERMAGHFISLKGLPPDQSARSVLSRHLMADGTVLEVEVVSLNIIYEGRPARLSVMHDLTERRKAESALETSEQRLRAIFNSGPQGILLLDLEGRLLSVNPQAVTASATLFGHELHPGDRLEDFLSEVNLEPFRVNFQKSLAGESFQVERPIPRPDGGQDWYEILYSPVYGSHETVTGICMTTLPISKRKFAEAESRENEEKFRHLFDYANDAIYLYEVSPDGTTGLYLEVNHVACQRMGYSREDFLRMSPLDVLEPRQRRDMPAIWKKLLDQSHITFERIQVTRSGLKIPVEISAHTFPWKGRQVVLAVSRDLTERKRAEETIRRQAYYDPLTNLPNRMLFRDRLEQAMTHAKRGATNLAVMIMDLDRFKNINETLGHGTGDRLLVGVAERLLTATTEGMTLARLSGDEFIFLIPQAGLADEVYQHAVRVIGSLKEPFHLGEHEIHMTCSIGMALYPGDGEDPETLLKNAEAAMYRAKEQGRNNYQLYTSVMNAKAFKQLLMENSLRRAVERNEFIVHFQPQVDLETHRVSGAEALVRWSHPDLGLVFPSEFIGLAEETGLILAIGEWVMREACTLNKKWQDKGLPMIPVSVNLSARQFQQKNLVGRIEAVLRETGVDSQWLGLEITESIALRDADLSLTVLKQLRGMGIKLSLDDFGTGYSSLSYLKKFPIQTLKLDQSFVRDLTTDANDAAIATAVLALAKSLKLAVIAEGVETEGQLEYLRTQGCRFAQGYLLSHPLPADDFERFLAQPQVKW